MQNQHYVDNTLEVVRAAPPWNLTGEGYIILCSFDRDFVEQHGFVPPALQGRFEGGLGAVMCMNYATSDIGPYREVLFIPGQFNIGGKSLHSVTKIFVSTWESVINGRENWGLPKELAYFDCDHSGGFDHLRILQNDEVVVDLTMNAYSPLAMPITTAIIPEAWRELVQFQDGKAITVTPSAFGHFHLANVKSASFNSAHFPDINKGHIYAVFKATGLSLHLPKAEEVH